MLIVGILQIKNSLQSLTLGETCESVFFLIISQPDNISYLIQQE